MKWSSIATMLHFSEAEVALQWNLKKIPFYIVPTFTCGKRLSHICKPVKWRVNWYTHACKNKKPSTLNLHLSDKIFWHLPLIFYSVVFSLFLSQCKIIGNSMFYKSIVYLICMHQKIESVKVIFKGGWRFFFKLKLHKFKLYGTICK